ncbi:olfactory receptor 14K1-like [Octodon degus]|uniref:Olfactory receptor n=1 Tax=Octodon degus TaxID=10160 RepID=A0A6P3FYP4_OCTDE|nr:olfactory receptor 14K1-like [Octodon degus]
MEKINLSLIVRNMVRVFQIFEDNSLDLLRDCKIKSAFQRPGDPKGGPFRFTKDSTGGPQLYTTRNQTLLRGFLLLRLTDSRALLGLQAALLSLAYLVATLENLTTVLLTVLDYRLHTPMYYFLRHLSYLDLCLISTTVPKSIVNSVTMNNSISFMGCMCQVFLVVLSAGSEVGILTAMSYDRYVAICQPLHYEAVMSKRCCVHLVAVSWLSGLFFGILYSAGTFSLDFCGSKRINQFFCDVPSLLKLSCSEEHAAINGSLVLGVFYGFSCLVCIVVSYVFIFSTVMKIPSRQSWSKAFSTCTPHLVVVLTFLLTATVVYLKPASDASPILDLLCSVFYSAVPPTLNPIIYCLKNRDFQSALSNLLRKARHELMET